MSRWPALVLLSGSFTAAFAACAGETQVLNAVDADGAGQAGQATSSSGSGAAVNGGGHNLAGAGGSSAQATGGSANRGMGGASGDGASNAGTGNLSAGASAGAPASGGAGPVGGAGTAGSGGAGNAGVANGGSQAGGGSAGAAGMAGQAALLPCNSSSGQGCAVDMFCVDVLSDSCVPDLASSCDGYCEPTLTPPTCTLDDDCPTDMRCLPDATNAAERRCVGSNTPSCEGDTDCPDGFVCREQACVADGASCAYVGSCEDGPLDACAAGYTRAATELCAVPCVPIQRCACSQDADCPYPISCDRIQQRCAIPLQAPGCAMTYDPGTCDGSYPAFAFVDGGCAPVRYSGCGGNDNHFQTLEECMLSCEGRPRTTDCPEGRVAAHVCLACGGGGGCRALGDFCVQTCALDRDCTTVGQSCLSGICQVQGCF